MIGYGIPYMGTPSLQSIDSIIQDTQNRLDNFKQQRDQLIQSQQMNTQQPTNLTQNFQLAPSSFNNNFRIVSSIDEVNKEIVIGDTYFLSKDFCNMWLKNSRGDIRTFTVEEILPKDEKDIMIENLQRQIEELKGENINAKSSKPNDGELYQQPSTGYDDSIGDSITTEKSTDVSAISSSKTTKRKS